MASGLRSARAPRLATAGALWLCALIGPLAWVVDEQVGYALVDWSCRAGDRLALHAVSLAALAVIVAGAAVSRVALGRRTKVGTAESAAPGRIRFATHLGTLLSLLFGSVVLIDWAAKFLFDPCQR